MRIAFLGRAGLYIETAQGSILCDPWFNPVFFASWFPFPSNEHIDPATIGSPTYLYVFHLHRDHFNESFLRDHVSKEATVLLLNYPLDKLERELRRLGFTRFVRTKHGLLVRHAGRGPVINEERRIADGVDGLVACGPFDAHFLQFSGANWYPMVCRWPERAKRALARRKRENDLARAMGYVRSLRARFMFPSAGPPCFLDDDLFQLNDCDHGPHSIFPDQSVCLEHVRARGYTNGRLLLPGSVAEVSPGACSITHPFPEPEVRGVFERKREYLDACRARQRLRIEVLKCSWPQGGMRLLDALREWRTAARPRGPHLRRRQRTRAARLRTRADPHRLPRASRVRVEGRASCVPLLVRSRAHRGLDPAAGGGLGENELFLPCRFQAERDGPYNEYVYHFFKALSLERLEYVEGFHAEREPMRELWECDGYLVQRRCPHMKADLARFGHVEDSILTCTMHGWQFELASGRCLAPDDRTLYRVPADEYAGGAGQTLP